MPWAWILAAILLLSLLPNTGEAGPSSAKALFREGNRLYEKRDYTGALARFEEAYARKNDPRILLNMGLTREKLDRLPKAAVDYERFLEAAAGGRYLKRARAVRGLLEKLRKKVASVLVACAVDGAVVSVGASKKGTTPLPFPVYLKAGTYQLTVEKTGHVAFRRQLTLAAGQHEKLEVPLAALPPPKPVRKPAGPKTVVLKPLPPAPRPQPLTRARPIYKRWWFWTAIGVVAAGSAAAVIATQAGGDNRLPGGELGKYSLD